MRHVLAARAFRRIRGSRQLSTPAIDVSLAREHTRGCRPGKLFLDSAGASLPPSVVVDRQIAYLQQEDLHGGYVAADDAEAELEAWYPSAAKLLGCAKDEVAFAESATRAWTLLFHSVRLSPGDRIMTSASDYGSNFVSYIQARERWGAEIVVVPDDETGQLDLARLKEEAAHPRARLISMNHVPTCGGTVQPAREVGAIAREHGVLYLLDACQSVGQMAVDVSDIGCDMLTATGRKFLRGPRSTGLLYMRKGTLDRLDPSVLDQEGAILLSETEYRLRTDARVFEQFEYSFAGKVGMTVAMDYAMGWGLQAIESRVRGLAAGLREQLRALEGVEVTDIGRELSGIVTFRVEGLEARRVKAALLAKGINVTVSAAAGGAPRVWFDRRGLTSVVRASPHYFNTEEELVEFVAAVDAIRRAA